MRNSLILRSDLIRDVTLRTISKADCENLRQWKNANRFAFFFQRIITPEQQEEWFRAYCDREDDYMFMVLNRGDAIGCMGFRLIKGRADIYNVILGRPEMSRKGLMSKAIKLMCGCIYSNFAHGIGVKVLRSNPALKWYEKNGFRTVIIHDTFLELSLDIAQARLCDCEMQVGSAST